MVRSSRFLTARQAKNLDSQAREYLGISTLVLMENAGRAVAEEVLRYPHRKKRVAIFCGRGNNGGDGFVATRHLLCAGKNCDVFLAGDLSEVRNEAKVNLEILLKLKHRLIEVKQDNLALVKRQVSKCDLIIDALLGVGLKGEVKGIYRDLIALINNAHSNVLSVDIPSGLDATTGEILGSSIKADRTITFVAKKRGMIFTEGRRYCGRVVVKDLGVPL